MDFFDPLYYDTTSQYAMITTEDSSQYSTPAETPEEELGDSIVVSLSAAFHPDAHLDELDPDVVVVSSDQVSFYVHYHKLLRASRTQFAGLISKQTDGTRPTIFQVAQDAVVLNVMMHGLYDLSCSHYHPTFDVIIAALEGLKAYGVSLSEVLKRESPTYNLFLGQAPLQPIRAFALACENELEDLAIAISPHLLGYSLADLSDELAVRIGPRYMKRLCILHHSRLRILRELLLAPPFPHAPTPRCSFMDQKALTRAWALASAQLAWDARPDISTHTIRGMLEPLREQLGCDLCRNTLDSRINQAVVQWSLADRTI